RVMQIPLAELIAASVAAQSTLSGAHRLQEIAGPADGSGSHDSFQVAARKPLDWEQDVVPGQQHDDLVQSLLTLELVARHHASEPFGETLGIDLGGTLELGAAKAFVRRTVAAAVQG